MASRAPNGAGPSEAPINRGQRGWDGGQGCHAVPWRLFEPTKRSGYKSRGDGVGW